MKILAHVLIVNGSSYVEKFTEKTGGFVIMKYRLQTVVELDNLMADLLCNLARS